LFRLAATHAEDMVEMHVMAHKYLVINAAFIFSIHVLVKEKDFEMFSLTYYCQHEIDVVIYFILEQSILFMILFSSQTYLYLR